MDNYSLTNSFCINVEKGDVVALFTRNGIHYECPTNFGSFSLETHFELSGYKIALSDGFLIFEGYKYIIQQI